MEIDWVSESEGVWAAKEIDGNIVASSGDNPSLGLSVLSTAGALSDVAEPPLVKHDSFFEVTDGIDQRSAGQRRLGFQARLTCGFRRGE